MKIYKSRSFVRFARREEIFDPSLIEAIERAERGLVDADLGGGLIKQRVARRGQGRSGGYRMLLAYKIHDRAVFLLGFSKSDRENIEPGELLALRRLAANWLSADAKRLAEALKDESIVEIERDE